MLNEALIEEKQRIPLKNRRIRKKLIDFRTHLLDSELSINTAKTYFAKVLVFYKHFEVELPKLPEVQLKKEYESGYQDLPTKEDIAKAVKICDPLMKAIILFMSSSGTAKAETLSLTVNDFINATNEYHKRENTKEIIEQLCKKSNVIPTFYLKRIKTNKFYYTYCYFEATTYISNYLKTRRNLKNKDKLFDITDSSLTLKFRQINDSLNWGFKGKYRFFRPHTLRKFHISNIGLSSDYIDLLQGRGRSDIHETYIKTNPKELKKIYQKSMHNLLIFNKPPREIHEDYTIIINLYFSGHEYKQINGI